MKKGGATSPWRLAWVPLCVLLCACGGSGSQAQAPTVAYAQALSVGGIECG